MKPIYHYSTVSEALDELNELGFTYDYNIHQSDIINKPTEHQVKHVYRYEGNSDPGDSAIVYGIASSDGKGGFVAGFSAKQIMKLLLYCLSCVLKIVTMNAELSLSPLIQKKRTKIH
jgi:hypothetical protein